MKKLFAIVAIFIAIRSTAQIAPPAGVHYTTGIAYGTITPSKDGYDYKTWSFDRIRITITPTNVSVDDKAKSEYTIGTELMNYRDGEGLHIMSWSATDRKGGYCVIDIKDFKPGAAGMTIHDNNGHATSYTWIE